MHGLTPLNAIAPLRTELTGSAEAPSATVPSSELTFPDNDIWAYLERRSSPILALASLVATVATVVLIIQCFRALHSDKKLTSLRMNGRTLAEGGSGSCNVGFPQHVHGMYVTQTASRAHIELVYVWWLACNRDVGREHRNYYYAKELRVQGNSSTSEPDPLEGPRGATCII